MGKTSILRRLRQHLAAKGYVAVLVDLQSFLAENDADFFRELTAIVQDELSAAAARIPIAGLSLPEDIADLAVFLASDAAHRITGQTVHVNGGDYLT